MKRSVVAGFLVLAASAVSAATTPVYLTDRYGTVIQSLTVTGNVGLANTVPTVTTFIGAFQANGTSPIPTMVSATSFDSSKLTSLAVGSGIPGTVAVPFKLPPTFIGFEAGHSAAGIDNQMRGGMCLDRTDIGGGQWFNFTPQDSGLEVVYSVASAITNGGTTNTTANFNPIGGTYFQDGVNKINGIAQFVWVSNTLLIGSITPAALMTVAPFPSATFLVVWPLSAYTGTATVAMLSYGGMNSVTSPNSSTNPFVTTWTSTGANSTFGSAGWPVVFTNSGTANEVPMPITLAQGPAGSASVWPALLGADVNGTFAVTLEVSRTIQADGRLGFVLQGSPNPNTAAGSTMFQIGGNNGNTNTAIPVEMMGASDLFTPVNSRALTGNNNSGLLGSASFPVYLDAGRNSPRFDAGTGTPFSSSTLGNFNVAGMNALVMPIAAGTSSSIYEPWSMTQTGQTTGPQFAPPTIEYALADNLHAYAPVSSTPAQGSGGVKNGQAVFVYDLPSLGAETSATILITVGSSGGATVILPSGPMQFEVGLDPRSNASDIAWVSTDAMGAPGKNTRGVTLLNADVTVASANVYPGPWRSAVFMSPPGGTSIFIAAGQANGASVYVTSHKALF